MTRYRDDPSSASPLARLPTLPSRLGMYPSRDRFARPSACSTSSPRYRTGASSDPSYPTATQGTLAAPSSPLNIRGTAAPPAIPASPLDTSFCPPGIAPSRAALPLPNPSSASPAPRPPKDPTDPAQARTRRATRAYPHRYWPAPSHTPSQENIDGARWPDRESRSPPSTCTPPHRAIPTCRPATAADKRQKTLLSASRWGSAPADRSTCTHAEWRNYTPPSPSKFRACYETPAPTAARRSTTRQSHSKK